MDKERVKAKMRAAAEQAHTLGEARVDLTAVERIIDEEPDEPVNARLVAAYKDYIAVLCEEIGDFAGLAISHGFTSRNVERGKACREAIAAAEAAGR